MRRRPVLLGCLVLGAAVAVAGVAVLPSSGPPTTLRVDGRDYRHPTELAAVDPGFRPTVEVAAGQVFAPAEIVGAVPTVVDLQAGEGRTFRYGLVGGP